MEFNIINTTKNRENLVSGNISWRCVKKDCSAYVKTNCSKSTLIEIKDIHNHEPNTIEDLNFKLTGKNLYTVNDGKCCLPFSVDLAYDWAPSTAIAQISDLQVLTNKNGFYLPLIIPFLLSKSFDCYLAMWNFICELCINENQQPFNLIRVSMHLDFDIAAHQVFGNVFKNSTIKACRFHLEFSYYILYNYIIIGCKFPPSIWAEPLSEAPRTTNCAESFHKHFNAQFYSPHPLITNFIENLKLIQVETNLKIKEVNKGTVKPKRNGEKERIEFACTTWTEYQIKNITRVQYLKKIAYTFRGIDLL
ncbi:Uncharacterized protein FWK35_00002132 [Aphis craccivora]|uniref:MULE domain-containing protein n=1 Tax=Aphis craccivora TaxID=307492 RepID=A0A6G0ZEG0_APHCR|nr:Uncharacterized protein FWK35_00002132 [Aphis craccivora]